MSISKYIEIYNYWQSKSIEDGFTLKQFKKHCNIYIDLNSSPDHDDYAIASKLAYRSLHETRDEEIKSVGMELGNCLWL